jgi:hypothetical protein
MPHFSAEAEYADVRIAHRACAHKYYIANNSKYKGLIEFTLLKFACISFTLPI